MNKITIMLFLLSGVAQADNVTTVNVFNGDCDAKHSCSKTVDVPVPVAVVKKMQTKTYKRTVKNTKTFTHEIVREVVREKIVEKPVYVDRVVVKKYVKYVPEYKANTLRVVAGIGPLGISKNSYTDSVTLNQNTGLVFGVEYARQLDDDWSIGGTVLSNATFLVGPGYSW